MQNSFTQKFFDFYQNPDLKLMIDKCMLTIYTPCLHARQVGITSKQILDCKKAGLLFDQDRMGWTEFSIRDGMWLRFIGELRKFGMPYEDIKKVKNSFLLDLGSVFENLSNLKNSEPDNQALKVMSEIIENNRPKDYDENEPMNLFEIVIAMLLLFKSDIDISFYFDEDHYAFLTSWEPITITQRNNVGELYKLMSKKSFALINIKSLMSGFFENEKLDQVDGLFFGLMNKFEKDILSKVRSGDYQQVIIKIDNGEVIQLRLKRKKDNESESKLSRLFKKGDYKEIQLITRDGKVVSYDETEIIKLNKK